MIDDPREVPGDAVQALCRGEFNAGSVFLYLGAVLKSKEVEGHKAGCREDLGGENVRDSLALRAPFALQRLWC